MPALPESELTGQRIVNKDFQVLGYFRMTSRSLGVDGESLTEMSKT